MINRESHAFRRLTIRCVVALATLAGPLASAAWAAEHGRDRDHHWAHNGWHEGWYRRPDIYYSAPPVVYPPYGYYEQAPGATFSLNIR